MRQIKNNISFYLNFFLPILFWVILALTSRSFLLQIESRSMFLYDWFWIKGALNTPNGFLSVLSLFLTQFLHLPWIGSFMWVMMLCLTTGFTIKMYRISPSFTFLAWIPAFLLAGANMSLGYLIYIMNSPGYFFEPVLGYLLILTTVAFFRKIRTLSALIPLMVIWSITGFLVAGYYAFASLLATGIDQLNYNHNKNVKYIPLITAIASIIITPPLLYGFTTYNLSLSWTLGLPTALYEETHARTISPVFLATLIPLILPLIHKLTSKDITRSILFQAPVLTFCATFLFISWSKDINFRTELSMIQEIEDLEWEKVVKEMQKINDRADSHKTYQPTRVMVLLKDLALIKTGLEGQKAFSFEDGSQKQRKSYDIPMVLQIGRELYLHYGIPGFCHRWCLEETGEFGWSYSNLKYLSMASICMNDRLLTIKYLDMLDKTLFYRDWSATQRRLIYNPEMLLKSSPYDKIFPLICYTDKLNDDQRGCEFTISHHFTGPRPDNATPLFDRVSLFWALKSQDSKLFWSKLFLYLSSTDINKLDRYYQEAAYLFSNIENDKNLLALPYDKSTKDLYNAFLNTAQKHEFDIQSLQDARQLFPVRLRNTYYYYYYFVRGLETF